MRRIRTVLLGLLVLAGGAGHAATLRYASGFDPQTLDPHALALLYQTRVVTQVYEGLVNRAKDFKTLEPSLATRWEMVNPTTWRFTLRPNVKFHDGTSFTADDAVFSIERALQKTSQRANQMRGITGARKVDALTIEVLSAAPDAVLPEKLWPIAMMSKAWCEEHKVTLPQDYNAKQETYAVRHANGTGPFVLASYESDVRTVLKANPQWWGKGTPAGGGNLDEVQYIVIQSDATRLAALQSNQVDFVIDPPFQDLPRLKADPALKVVEIEDIGTQYLAFDQRRAELPGSGLPGQNPFKDLRVRKAIQLAVDTDLIVRQVLRGQGTATGSHVAPLVDGYLPAFEKRPKADPAAARALLKQAGYERGFAVSLDCVNASYRAAVCQAIAAMLEKVAIKVNFQPSPTSTFFPKLTQATSSFLEFGWSPGVDPWNILQSLVRTNDGLQAGAFNAGRYSNPKLDALIDAIRVEPDITRRRSLVADALKLMHEDLPLMPLYRRHHNWAMRPGVKVVQWPNDVLELRWVTMAGTPAR
ncbi:ABC transporter substrate-binding protein [Ideonella sp. BN130291]|uniref:ABC transporter substrate-binding protein n=1 Tax=Ideonella sp. BN130291 TaxID=3112940 RepID=UPI002E25BA3D|nr:ABC transporter substrate-binding protein [Ideonella sp. BN130291]